jgi:hypothetical protein
LLLEYTDNQKVKNPAAFTRRDCSFHEPNYFLRIFIKAPANANRASDDGSGTTFAVPESSTRTPLGVLPGSETTKSSVFIPLRNPELIE